jgi:hypothetical protein
VASIDDVLGVWGPDLKRWPEVDPKLANVSFFLRFILGDLRVTFTSRTLTIEDYGVASRPRHFTFEVAAEEEERVVLDVEKGGKKGVYVIEFVDSERINLRLTEPKHDVLALKRILTVVPPPDEDDEEAV